MGRRGYEDFTTWWSRSGTIACFLLVATATLTPAELAVSIRYSTVYSERRLSADTATL
jgi:hypothetical protein